jgi:hypothetical protein
VKKATYYALDIGSATACYYFAGWRGVAVYAVVWIAAYAAFAGFAFARMRYRTPFARVVWGGEMSDVLIAVADFGNARLDEEISELSDSSLALACAYYGSMHGHPDRFSPDVQSVGVASHGLALAEIERRGIESKLKYAAVTVATARMNAGNAAEGFTFIISTVKLLAAAAIACLV